jgi:GNAT superfamily N-acetyltransferase
VNQELAYRPATPDDLATCERIWIAGINDYLRPLNQPEVPDDNPGLRELHAHALATDPARFWVATRGERVVGFGSAVERGALWFLSMLFVEPAEQGNGVGRELLRRLLPASLDGRVLGTATDSLQPISNALYASLGIGPRLPIFDLVGRPRPDRPLPALPDGVGAMPGELGGGPELDALDREVLGFEHPQDHAFIRHPDRRLFTYRDGGGGLLGYGYTSVAGRVGPIAVRDRALMAPVVGHLLRVVEPRGASTMWLSGAQNEALTAALVAGLRIEGFPLLLCWSRPFADFERYVLISPGLP